MDERIYDIEADIETLPDFNTDLDNTSLIRGPRGYSITRVEKIAGTHAPGSLDTYRVYIDNGDTDDFEVYNGKDAYTYAVAAGYEGTEAEFAALMGHFAEYYEAAEDAAETAVAAKNEAVSSKNAASQSAAGALSSAQSAAESALAAGLSAQGADNSATAAEANAHTAGEYAEDAEDEADRAEAARTAIENMTVSAETLPAGSAASVTKSIVSDVAHLIFGIPKGTDGTSIANIAKTSSSGLVDTYTVTLTDGTTYTITVTNGAKGDTGTGIASVRQTGGTHAPGTTDTYTVTLTDGTASIFTVYNGANGEGSGDMTAAVYDPAGGARQVAFEDEVEAKYTLPSGGIPKTDLADAVQTSLGKADTALQSVPGTYRTAAAQDVIDSGKADADELTAHTENTSNPHGVTKAQVGLGNVPNVSTNNQTPTYSEASTLTTLTSGEKLSTAFGKIKKGISDLISHLADTVKHITAAERTAWNAKQNALTFDTTPTASSTNPVTSDGVKSYVDGAISAAIGNAIGGSY